MDEFKILKGLDKNLPNEKNVNALYHTTDTKRVFIGETELQNKIISNYVISEESGEDLLVSNTDNVEAAFGKVEKSINDINETIGDIDSILTNILGV